jgi:hypothetical protein
MAEGVPVAIPWVADQERANDDRVIEVDRTVARRDGRQAEQENEH